MDFIISNLPFPLFIKEGNIFIEKILSILTPPLLKGDRGGLLISIVVFLHMSCFN